MRALLAEGGEATVARPGHRHRRIAAQARAPGPPLLACAGGNSAWPARARHRGMRRIRLA